MKSLVPTDVGTYYTAATLGNMLLKVQILYFAGGVFYMSKMSKSIGGILKQRAEKKLFIQLTHISCIFRTDAGSGVCCENYEEDETGECNCMIDTVEINFFSLNESEYALCNNHSSMKKKL